MDNDPEDASKPANEAPANLKPADLHVKTSQDGHVADRPCVSGSTASEREPHGMRGTHFQLYLLQVADELLWWTVVFLEAKMDFLVHKACTAAQLLTPHPPTASQHQRHMP